MNSIKKQLYFVLSIAVLLWVSVSEACAEIQIYHQSPTIIEEGNTAFLTFSVPGINPGEVQEAFLFYHMDGDVAYRQKKASFSQNNFTVRLPIPENSSGTLEYYFEIQLTNGESLSFPENRSANGPIRIEIVENRTVTGNEGKEDEIEYTILSPEPGEEVAQNDVVIAITLFYEEGAIDTASSSFQLLLDNKDITKQADASEYFFTYVPEELEAGEHAVSLKLNQEDGSVVDIASWSFQAIDPVAAARAAAEAEREPENFIPTGQAELSARNQVIAGSTNDMLNGNIQLSGQKGNVKYSAYGLLTSQEDARLQPQNRYGAELYIGNWFELQAGHIYPTLSPLTIAGQRVQGLNTALRPFNGAINLQFLYGKLRRNISNIYQRIQPQPQSFKNVVVDTSYTLNFKNQGLGTFQRNILGGRLGFGRRRTFNFGINVLKVEDDTGSIDVVRNYDDVIRKKPILAGSLSQADRNKLERDPNLLGINGNPLPKGNFVAGSDLMINLNKNRIQLRADGAISLLNEDITDGPLNTQIAENLGFEIDQEAEDLLDRLSWLIIVNENMNALPIRFDAGGTETNAEFFFPTGILGTQSELAFNYLKNNLRLKYRWIGPYFNSLANSTIRKDIAGITLTDRIRLFSNRIYVTLGYENLDDNVINDKDATTNTLTYRGNLSWYPVKRTLPRISLGIMNRIRENGVALFNPFSPAENVALQNFTIADGDTVIAPLARMSNTLQLTSSVTQQFDLFGVTHNASVNYSVLNTTDEVFAFGDAASNSVSFRVTNQFDTLPLNTHVGFSINNTETGSGLTDINIVGINLGGSVFFLDDKLNASAGIAFTRNTSEIVPLAVNTNNTEENSDNFYEPDLSAKSISESNSYIISASSRYNFNQNHAFVVTMRLTNVTNTFANTRIPDDRVLQARYLFSF